MVWGPLEDTQPIGCSTEQKLNSLTWSLRSLAGSPLSILHRTGGSKLEAWTGQKTREPVPRAAELLTAPCFFAPICSCIFSTRGSACGIRLPQDGQPSRGLPSHVCTEWEDVSRMLGLTASSSFPDGFPTFPNAAAWLGIHRILYSSLKCSSSALGHILQSD